MKPNNRNSQQNTTEASALDRQNIKQCTETPTSQWPGRNFHYLSFGFPPPPPGINFWAPWIPCSLFFWCCYRIHSNCFLLTKPSDSGCWKYRSSAVCSVRSQHLHQRERFCYGKGPIRDLVLWLLANISDLTPMGKPQDAWSSSLLFLNL
jgi:hypothetical protein